MRPWSSIPIHECGERMVALPAQLLRLEPHPYQALGAPYGADASPFWLREQVVQRLLRAQIGLQRRYPSWRLAIFDGWRPLTVQSFMVEHTIREQCALGGIDPDGSSLERERVVADVLRFWALPSAHPATPPPHSTGAAVDLTLADADGRMLAMGSAIDAIGSVSEPDHFLECARRSSDGEQRQVFLRWHGHRQALREAMEAEGFAQHPNEWWHFSWGDQLWAWSRGEALACYGRSPEPSSRPIT
jgi:D-alanyl-D-alanine dipeptidase